MSWPASNHTCQACPWPDHVGNVFSAYDLSDDNFALSPEYDLLYTELTGAVVLYIEEYGV